MTPQRYMVERHLGGRLAPAEDGPVVLFADIEEALQDSARLAWLMPLLVGSDDAICAPRMEVLNAGLQIGLVGNALVDWAMEGTPHG